MVVVDVAMRSAAANGSADLSSVDRTSILVCIAVLFQVRRTCFRTSCVESVMVSSMEQRDS